MPPGFCRPAMRERCAYPHGSVTSEQRNWAAKEQGSLLPLFINTALCWLQKVVCDRHEDNKKAGHFARPF